MTQHKSSNFKVFITQSRKELHARLTGRAGKEVISVFICMIQRFFFASFAWVLLCVFA
jgi:hypothetical protein